MKPSTLWLLLLLPLLAFALIGGWMLWTEQNPESERELRIIAQEQLEEWFPEAMSLPPELIGFHPAGPEHEQGQPDVILIHGLDEPGGIWTALAEALAGAGMTAWEFRYPNDQAIDHSADLLALRWEELESDEVFLVGHSMGGLLIRDFVSRWRHPVEQSTPLAGPEVAGTILVATPNQGSEWARLRAWLEIREWMADIPEGRLSLFSRLRHGTGAAKIDLRPDSRFLTELNARPWPDRVPIQIIGGRLAEPTPAMLEGLQTLMEDMGQEELHEAFELWWRDAGEGIGDGAVPVESLSVEGAPEPMIVHASHRGLLVEMPWSDREPPAVGLVVQQLETWSKP